MPVLHPPETEYAKESIKWEAHPTQMGPGLRPYEYRDWPAMLFKAGRPPNGGAHIIEETRIAADEKDAENWHALGFRATPLEAIDYLDALQRECGDLAAELNFEQKNRLSPRASAEVDAARAQHAGVSGHMPSVPVTPLKPRAKDKE